MTAATTTPITMPLRYLLLHVFEDEDEDEDEDAVGDGPYCIYE